MKLSKILCSVLITSYACVELSATSNLPYIRLEYFQHKANENIDSKLNDSAFIGTAREYIITISNEKPNLIDDDSQNSEDHLVSDRGFVFDAMSKLFNKVNDQYRDFEKKMLGYMSGAITDDIIERAKNDLRAYNLKFILNGEIIENSEGFTKEQLEDRDGSLKKALENYMPNLRQKVIDNLKLAKKDIEDNLALLNQHPEDNPAQIRKFEEFLKKTEQTISEIVSKTKDEDLKDKNIYTQRRKDKVSSITEDVNIANTAMLDAFADLAVNSTELTSLLLNPANENEAKSLIKAVDESLSDIKNTLSQDLLIDVVKFNQDISTTNRLALLSNPNRENLALAYALKNLKNDSFADNESGVLSELVRDYTDRFSSDKNLWANVFGAKAHIKGSKSPSLVGVNLGYDKAFDDSILGIYTTYAKSTLNAQTLNAKSYNYQFGAYARKFIQNHEIDSKISAGTSKNRLLSSIGTFNQEAKYRGKNIKFDLDYGYVTKANEWLFAKPIFGLGYDYSVTAPFDQTGKMPFEIHRNSHKAISAKLALELRAFHDSNYFYVTPGVLREIYKKSSGLYANFVGSDKEFLVSKDNKKNTYFTLQTGANLNLSHNLSFELSLGTKAGKNQQIYNATAGLRYKF